ncbi:MarR family winged helix-turn-helix transcriptional regulator [Eubacteriales bacterium KG127]
MSNLEIDMKILIGMHRNVTMLDKKTARLAFEEGLTLGQFAVLETLYSKGPQSIGSVRDRILSSVGTISVIVKNLEQRGLIKRVEHKRDKRICVLHLTEYGKDTIKRVIPKNFDMIRSTFAVLTEYEKRELLKLVKKIGGILDEQKD